ncbi:SET domain-containing protein [Pallidibacillus thermolactis subsp. kokeshiiformis]|jgi:uncharacterized protein|nr:SET domain-containing protein [Pallidibacillus thermolactis subsp. kokeshiiformis]
MLRPIVVKDTKKYGRGVFATRLIKKGELIESAPAIIIPMEEWENMKDSILSNYVFRWKKDKAIVLGYGLLYNHSYSPNAYYITNFDHYSIDFYARRDIHKGEEIKVNYNGDPLDQTSVWFDVIE